MTDDELRPQVDALLRLIRRGGRLTPPLRAVAVELCERFLAAHPVAETPAARPSATTRTVCRQNQSFSREAVEEPEPLVRWTTIPRLVRERITMTATARGVVVAGKPFADGHLHVRADFEAVKSLATAAARQLRAGVAVGEIVWELTEGEAIAEPPAKKGGKGNK